MQNVPGLPQDTVPQGSPVPLEQHWTSLSQMEAVHMCTKQGEGENSALCCPLKAAVTREPQSWTKLCEMCSAERQHCIEWVLHTWELWTERIPLFGRYLAQFWGNLDVIMKNINWFFFLTWKLLKPREKKSTETEAKEKGCHYSHLLFYPLLMMPCQDTHWEVYWVLEWRNTTLFLYNESRYISMWHQREVLNNDVFCTNERLYSKGR